MLENGTVLDDKYEILKQIGRGGTSIVYLAMNQKLNQQWLIKEIKDILRFVALNRRYAFLCADILGNSF